MEGNMLRTLRVAAARWERSDGGITTLQVLIMFPVLVLVLMFAMQVALTYYAKQVALDAAQAGVNAVRFGHYGPGDETRAEATAQAAAQDYITKHGGNLLTSPGMKTPVLKAPYPPFTVDYQIVVEITGQPIALLPLPLGPVDQQAQGAVETWTWGNN
jgi:Flp pilus assembly protein TadG